MFANNPAMTAYAEARRMAGDEPVRVVSLGTGRLTRPIRHSEAAGWGVAQWARPLIHIVFDGMSGSVDYQLEHTLGPERHRFQIDLDVARDDLDDASPRNLARLQDQARRMIRAHSARLDRVVETLGRDFARGREALT